MFRIKLAGHCLAVENKYPYTERLCRDYFTQEPAEYSISVTQDEISAESRAGEGFSDAYLESLAVYRKICEYLLRYDIMLFHCSALALDGEGYLFTAPSGTGKSTHARLWRERFGERVLTVNDDKPLLTFEKGEIRVWGTPYAGKERLQTNTSAPVRGIVVLQQAAENSIRRLSLREAYPLLLTQAYRPKNPAALVKTMDMVAALAALPVFSLGCTISQEAVTLSHDALTRGDLHYEA